MLNLQQAFKTIFNVTKMETEHEYALKQHIQKEKDVKNQLQETEAQVGSLIRERDYFRDQVKGMVEAWEKINDTMHVQKASFFYNMQKNQREMTELADKLMHTTYDRDKLSIQVRTMTRDIEFLK